MFKDGKRVVLVDDSIVRGNTSRKLVEVLRDAGATEVHMRISAPPTTNSCFYGVDTPTRSELIASQKTVEEIRAALAAFGGVNRRFTKVAEIDGVTIIDDYGHHPVEIAAVLKAARQAWDRALDLGEQHGFRNAQTTVIACTPALAAE